MRKLGKLVDGGGTTIAEMFAASNALSGDSDGLSRALYSLSETVIRGIRPDSRSGGLGGDFGYGADYENAVFMMHHYCWCEKEDCPWCGNECGCSFASCEHYLDGEQIEDWSAANDKILAPLPFDVAEYGTKEHKAASRKFNKTVAERDRRLITVYAPWKHTCARREMYADRKDWSLDWEPRSSAPNFWHKPSGLRVWWYKWIGRDMEVYVGDAKEADLGKILRQCYRSIPKSYRMKAQKEAVQ